MHIRPQPMAMGQRGFTLLELLVVLLIIALLAGYVGPKLFGEVGKARTKTASTQMRSISSALDRYRLDVGSYPSSNDGLQALLQAPAGSRQWAGPYLSGEVPNDPWDKPYVYRQPGDTGKEYDLLSLGSDGQPGGEGEQADLVGH